MPQYKYMGKRIDIFKVDSFEVNSNGFLIVDAYVTRAGVFDYVQNGQKVRELRPDDQVFDEDSMKSLCNVPVTDLGAHPTVMLNVDNARYYSVGHAGDTAQREGRKLKSKLVITDANCIKTIQEKKDRGEDIYLSCGYTTDVVDGYGEDEEDGYFDAIQTNIRYNHISIVPKGRAGDSVKIKYDEGGQETMALVKFTKNAIKMSRFSMDAVEANIDDSSLAVVERMSSKLDEALTALQGAEKDHADAVKAKDALQAKVDQLTEELTKVKKDYAELSDPNSAKFAELAKGREDVAEMAKKLGVELKKADGASKSIMELKIDIIKKHSPKADVAGKSDEYINSRVDSIKEILNDVAAGNTDNADALARLNTSGHTDAADAGKDARTDFIKRSQAAWKDEPAK